MYQQQKINMKEENKIKSKLSIGSDGVLTEVKFKEEAKFNGIPDLKGFRLPAPNRLLLRPLPQEDVTLPSGVIIPASSAEYKAVVVLAHHTSSYKTGDVVALDVNMFPNLWENGRETQYKNIPVVYLEGEEVLITYESHIIGCYGQRIEE